VILEKIGYTLIPFPGKEGITKSGWAAKRVPKGHAAFIANNFIIGELPEEPDEDNLFAPRLRELAQKSGYWDGKEPFHFSRVRNEKSEWQVRWKGAVSFFEGRE
jgi:dipeptidase